MNEKLFPDHPDLDTAFLNSTYPDDPETAALMFETYLADLPANVAAIQQSLDNHDIQVFRQQLHKQKPSFSYVGLTDLTEKFQHLYTICQQAGDLVTYRKEIDDTFNRIHSTTAVIKATLGRLQQL
jgi:HPt (histidine-containing phosphotransfer) domain-containing protein